MLVREGMTSEEAFIVANNFTNAASIVRASCRLQQTKPELRGKKYQSRVNKAEQDRVKELLGYKPYAKDGVVEDNRSEFKKLSQDLQNHINTHIFKKK